MDQYTTAPSHTSWGGDLPDGLLPESVAILAAYGEVGWLAAREHEVWGSMNRSLYGKAFRPPGELVEDADAVASQRGPRWGWLPTARVGHEAQTTDKLLVRSVQDSLVRSGLSRTEHTVAGGDTLHIPRVVSADAGPPGWVQIDLLPGQSAEDFTAHASALAQSLGVPQVWVVPLGRSRVRLELPTQRDRS
jgi:hypothetical protein